METTVEWLFSELKRMNLLNESKEITISILKESALIKEKKQIIDAFINGKINRKKHSEEYYNKTFNSL
jgi:hypothetical protein